MHDIDLSAVGLSENQRAIYGAILEAGKATPARLSSLTEIGRTTVYGICKELVHKGFIQEDDLKGVTYYYPTAPKDLVKITKRERQALVEKELAIEELAKSIERLPQSKTYAVPKIKFVEGEKEILQFFYNRTHTWVASSREEVPTWYGFLDGTFTANDEYQKWIDWYWAQPDLKNSELKMLSNKTSSEEAVVARQYSNRRVKYLEKSLNFTATQWILGDYSVTVVTREKPHYLVELHDAVYAENMRELYKRLYDDA